MATHKALEDAIRKRHEHDEAERCPNGLTRAWFNQAHADRGALLEELSTLKTSQRTPGTYEVCEQCQTPDFLRGCYKSGDARAVDCPHAITRPQG